MNKSSCQVKPQKGRCDTTNHSLEGAEAAVSAFGLYCANKEKTITIFSKSFKQCTLHALVSGAFLTAFGAATGVAQDMPALSMIIAAAGEVRVDTKCDDPPEGFMNNAGVPIGVDVSMAHEIANMRLAKRPR
jgi:hypothetical protein